ncbi:MAG TPA: hypothetical protein VG798_06690 [Rhizomicrobium sp.]|nr:hypothetical protein [Rhizomicrobium sp.]
MRIEVVFIGIGFVLLLCGMAFGMWMGANETFQYADAHAHLNLLGFVLPTLYGLLHRSFPGLARSRLAWPQCIAHFLGVLIFIPGIVIATVGTTIAGAIVGSIIVFLATATFAYMFFTAGKSG